MFKAFRFAMKYKHVLPELIEFAEICANTPDNRLTKKEKSVLMKQYWVIVKAIQAS